MIGQSVKLTTIRGIDVGIHYSWSIIFFLITFSLTARFASVHPHWTTVEHYAVGIATSLLFFVSILFHESAHSFVAPAKHIPVRSITLLTGLAAEDVMVRDCPAVSGRMSLPSWRRSIFSRRGGGALW